MAIDIEAAKKAIEGATAEEIEQVIGDAHTQHFVQRGFNSEYAEHKKKLKEKEDEIRRLNETINEKDEEITTISAKTPEVNDLKQKHAEDLERVKADAKKAVEKAQARATAIEVEGIKKDLLVMLTSAGEDGKRLHPRYARLRAEEAMRLISVDGETRTVHQLANPELPYAVAGKDPLGLLRNDILASAEKSDEDKQFVLTNVAPHGPGGGPPSAPTGKGYFDAVREQARKSRGLDGGEMAAKREAAFPTGAPPAPAPTQ